jgi:hypothetical protein
MEEALEMLAPYGGSYRGGLSNHGPMTVEALVALGRHDVVVGWVESYRGRLELSTALRERITEANWREALGASSRNGDWDQWFTNELAESPWREVLALWIPRLAPGIVAAGLHGVIRVGHAVCSLGVKETPLRIDELARALGYWAAEYMLLPGKHLGTGTLAPSSALAEIETLPRNKRNRNGLISTQMKALEGFEPFIDVIDLVDPSAGSPNFMADLVGTFAGIFINTNSSSFQFLHGVTGAAAVAEILPYIKAEQHGLVLAHAWQATAGIFARYGQEGLVADFRAGSNESSMDEVITRAVASGDPHTIKLVTACHREWKKNPDPRLLTAAAKRVG